MEELHAALHYHLKFGAQYDESEISGMESLFSPRDFLFTNAEQVKKIVETRQCAFLGAEGNLH